MQIVGQVENGGNGGPVGKPTGKWSLFSTRDDGQVENGDRLDSVTESCARNFAKNTTKK